MLPPFYNQCSLASVDPWKDYSPTFASIDIDVKDALGSVPSVPRDLRAFSTHLLSQIQTQHKQLAFLKVSRSAVTQDIAALKDKFKEYLRYLHERSVDALSCRLTLLFFFVS